MNQAQLKTFEKELQKVHSKCCLQTDSDGNYRPRIFLPTDPQLAGENPCGMYSRPVDIGDFDKPFFSGSGGTDEWVRTGLPPGSAW